MRVLDAAPLVATLRRRSGRDPLLHQLRELARELDVRLWLVGGYVRDAALGLRSSDVDLVAGPGCARLVRAAREAWGTRGFRFRKRGVTTWRFGVDDRRVDLVDAGRRGLRGDLERRELTINAVAFELLSARLEDPLGGLRDLRHGRLRPPRRGAFLEDPVRALRACRFVAQFPGFRLLPAARVEAAAAARRLRRAPVERVRQELERLLLGRDPAVGLERLAELGLRAAVLPELDPLASCVAGGGRPDVWSHTLETIRISSGPRRLPGARRATAAESDRLVLRWALLLHDVAKPRTLAVRTDGRPTFHGHEVIGARDAERVLRRLKLPKQRRRRIVWLVRNHLRPGHLADAGAPRRGLRRLVRDAGTDLPLLVFHAACDARGSGAADARQRWFRLRGVLLELLALADTATAPSAPLLDGRDVMRELGIGPGPRVGRWLARLRELQESGALRTRDDALEHLRTADRPG